MKIKWHLLFEISLALLILQIPASAIYLSPTENYIIIDHSCTRIDHIPQHWILKAKKEFRIAYGHTSHGSQIISGMGVLMLKSDLFSFNHMGTDGALSLHDRQPADDLGNPNRTEWYYRTRILLDNPKNDRNLIMWSWCGQVSTATEADIETYLILMSQLEKDYPDIKFVYMTGHLDGTGEEGNLNARNNQIRKFCRENNKILFDFAAIEGYDPDGKYFLTKRADDGCYYWENDMRKNWADEWCAAHPGECSSCSCAHSRSLNCDLKGRAFWWMMARLAGWNECDINGDGILDRKDFIERRREFVIEFFTWIKECWRRMEDCGDFNGDGVIDLRDKFEKRDSLFREMIAWMRNCGRSAIAELDFEIDKRKIVF